MDRYFLITVDTEGDNLWNWHHGQQITTVNTSFIPRFQELCEKYNLIPTYLTNYEMALDSQWVGYIKKKSCIGKAEIGMHIHAWNSPPDYNLENKFNGNAYITEYPDEIMYQKVEYIKALLENQMECDILSNRSGRWATNDSYFKILSDLGIIADCSVTPQLDLSKIPGFSKNCGNDYTHAKQNAYFIDKNLVEIPMSTRRIHCGRNGSLKHKAKTMLIGEELWLRPISKSYDDMLFLTKKIQNDGCDYLELMIHSSELMPGGSPYFKDNEEIEILYSILEQYFRYVASEGYIGKGVASYAQLFKANFQKR